MLLVVLLRLIDKTKGLEFSYNGEYFLLVSLISYFLMQNIAGSLNFLYKSDILQEPANGKKRHKKNRFGELKKVLQTVTQQMLSKQLKELEIDGLINRKVFQVVPPKVEYSLTDFGTSVIPVLRSLDEWNRRNSRTISTKLNKNFEESRIR